ncbi:MAG: hypothetical protein U1E53_10880 [Dongiaceae bacterium]
MTDDPLDAAFRGHVEMLEEHRARRGDLQKSASLPARSFEHCQQLLARSKALLLALRRRLAPAPDQPAPDTQDRAMKAAITAWNAAVLSPSPNPPPSHAAIAAYVRISPEPVEAARGKIVAMIVSRLERSDRPTLH